MRQEKGDRKQETGLETEESETGDGRQETDDRRRPKTGDRRWFSDVLSGQFSAFYLAGEFYQFSKIAYR